MKRWFAVGILSLLFVGAAGLWFVSQLNVEGDTARALDVKIDNPTDVFFYVVRAPADTPADEAILTRTFTIIFPGEEQRLGAGFDPRRSDSNCFDDEQFWIVRSISDAPYWRPGADAPERTLEDLEIVEHLPSDTCLPEGQLTVSLAG